jgi:hypothetical protein
MQIHEAPQIDVSMIDLGHDERLIREGEAAVERFKKSRKEILPMARGLLAAKRKHPATVGGHHPIQAADRAPQRSRSGDQPRHSNDPSQTRDHLHPGSGPGSPAGGQEASSPDRPRMSGQSARLRAYHASASDGVRKRRPRKAVLFDIVKRWVSAGGQIEDHRRREPPMSRSGAESTTPTLPGARLDGGWGPRSRTRCATCWASSPALGRADRGGHGGRRDERARGRRRGAGLRRDVPVSDEHRLNAQSSGPTSIFGGSRGDASWSIARGSSSSSYDSRQVSRSTIQQPKRRKGRT